MAEESKNVQKSKKVKFRGKCYLAITWRDMVTKNRSKPFAPHLARLNSALGSNHKTGRFSQWEEGILKPNLEVINFMMAEVIEDRVNFVDGDDLLKRLLDDIKI